MVDNGMDSARPISNVDTPPSAKKDNLLSRLNPFHRKATPLPESQTRETRPLDPQGYLRIGGLPTEYSLAWESHMRVEPFSAPEITHIQEVAEATYTALPQIMAARVRHRVDRVYDDLEETVRDLRARGRENETTSMQALLDSPPTLPEQVPAPHDNSDRTFYMPSQDRQALREALRETTQPWTSDSISVHARPPIKNSPLPYDNNSIILEINQSRDRSSDPEVKDYPYITSDDGNHYVRNIRLDIEPGVPAVELSSPQTIIPGDNDNPLLLGRKESGQLHTIGYLQDQPWTGTHPDLQSFLQSAGYVDIQSVTYHQADYRRGRSELPI